MFLNNFFVLPIYFILFWLFYIIANVRLAFWDLLGCTFKPIRAPRIYFCALYTRQLHNRVGGARTERIIFRIAHETSEEQLPLYLSLSLSLLFFFPCDQSASSFSLLFSLATAKYSFLTYPSHIIRKCLAVSDTYPLYNVEA
jgi:hypothetical protein